MKTTIHALYGALAIGIPAAVFAASGPAIAPPTGVQPVDISLTPVHAGSSLTMEALIGFVNSQPVFVRDILLAKDAELKGLARSARNITDFRDSARSVLRTEIDKQVYNLLALSAAKTSLSEDDQKRVEMYVADERRKLISQHGGSLALADQDLRPQGTSVEEQVAGLRKQITVELYRARFIEPRIVITGPMLKNEYERTISDWQVGAEIDLYTLSLPLSRWLHQPGVDGRVGPLIANPTAAQVQQAEVQAMAAAKVLAQKARDGADWAQLVEDNRSGDDQVNNGGHWGKVKKGSLRSTAVEDYVFTIPENSVGDPILVRDKDQPLKSYVIIGKVGKRTEARTIPFSEAQRTIRQRLFEKRRNELEHQFAQKLGDGAAVEAVDRMTDVVVDAAVSLYVTQ